VAKIGDGVIAGGTQAWPGGVDTRETFLNSANPDADSVYRIDAEVVNDLGAYALSITAELGNDPAGIHASVQARLEAIEARLDALEA